MIAVMKMEKTTFTICQCKLEKVFAYKHYALNNRT